MLQNRIEHFPPVDLSALSAYRQHGLTDLREANLMNRVDSKYLLPVQLLPELLNFLTQDFSVLTLSGQQAFTYQTTYFDTEQRSFYHAHHQGKRNRIKVRHRHYVDTATEFLEVKHKTNKGRTDKQRLACALSAMDNAAAQCFLQAHWANDSAHLQPVQWGTYQRLALANEAQGERLTLDFHLCFQDLPSARQVSLPDLVILEHKQQRLRSSTPLSKWLSGWRIRACRFSKYCMGSILTRPELKHNRFKPQLLALQGFTVRNDH